MPKITYLKEIDGGVWARLEMDFAIADGPLHIFTAKELRELKDKERQSVRDEIESALDRWRD